MEEDPTFNMPSVILAPMLIPKPALCNKPFELTLDGTTFVGFPILLKRKQSGLTMSTEEAKERLEESGTKQNRDELRLFNLCLVLKSASSVEDQHLGTIEQFQRVATQMGHALKHEEERCQYLTSQTLSMMMIREAWLLAQKNDVPNDSVRPDHRALTSQLLSVNSVSTEIRDIYHGLKDKGMINIHLNSWITIICSLRDLKAHPTWPIRPYQTLLLLPLEPPSTSWDQIFPPDSSPSVRRFIETVKPTKSFRELQVETDIPLAQMYRISAHLVYWNRARLINTLTKTNIYVINPNPPISSKPDIYFMLGKQFSLIFPSFKLVEILERFSYPKTLGEHVDLLISSLQRDFVEVVVWLLQRNLLVQLHTYFLLMIPESEEGEDDFTETEDTGYPASPTPLRAHEIAYLDSFLDRGPQFLLFQRLCPYFRGRHHAEEIMWRENVSREDLFAVVSKYSKIVVSLTLPSSQFGGEN
eukprot:TRINITY_DN11411_c0_g1_i2.p1 TRINITY_DN11411_c0_g1~~TRINITY_DN11411_c0_g1_i2.p1  ORF type:complete len:472 (-),score=71.77 TRINITY_DN11411_c0_g1_i2:3-1418(-)